MLDLLTDIDALLATNVNYLLGVWTHDALSFAKTPEETSNLFFNAKNQLTLWGPTGTLASLSLSGRLYPSQLTPN